MTKHALRELKVSHTGYYTPDDAEYADVLAIYRHALKIPVVERDGIGVDFDRRGFVRRVFAGGPAEKAGLLRGDQVLEADGMPFHPVRSLRGKAGKDVLLNVRRRRDDRPIEARVVPRRIDPAKEWLESQTSGARIVKHRGKSIAYMPIFSGAGDAPESALRDAVIGAFRDADALIIDFRDGWGGCNPSFLTIFDKHPPVLSQIGRDGRKFEFDAQWRKPLAILINGGTRSGKEVVAHAVKTHNLGRLVGERTAGAVVAGSCFLLKNKSVLMLAVGDVRVDGIRLEGIGVAPDVLASDDLEFAAGADPVLEAALEAATR